MSNDCETSMNLQFTCPLCGNHVLEEVMTGVTVTSKVNAITDGGECVYRTQANEGGEIERYQCSDCGKVLHDDQGKDVDTIIRTEEALRTFLRKVPLTQDQVITALARLSPEKIVRAWNAACPVYPIRAGANENRAGIPPTGNRRYEWTVGS